MIKLYDFVLSGNAHKVRLMLSLLHIEHFLVPVNILRGEQHAGAFRQLNPFAEVPVLIDGSIIVRDSNAILLYLADEFAPAWRGQSARERSAVHDWLAVAANELQHSLAALRRASLFSHPIDTAPAVAKGEALLHIMNQRLRHECWIALAMPSIADVAFYAHVAHAPEGGVSLQAYPHVQRWLNLIEALPGFISMPRTVMPALPQVRKHRFMSF